MAHLSVATVIEKNRIASEVAFVPLLEIDIIDPFDLHLVETVYYARNSEDIEYQGHTYLKGAFDITMSQQSGEIGDVSITLKDYTRGIQERMHAYGGGVGFNVHILVINTGNLAQPPEMREQYRVIAASVKSYDIEFTLGAENPLTLRFPRRNQIRDRCPWRYKGPECEYSGPLPTCDYTLQGVNGCAAHQNTMNFGGFPGIRNKI